MQSKGNAPNAEQIRWREEVRKMGCLYRYPGSVEIHHILGASAKQDGVPIGHLAILPVTNQAHREVEKEPKDVQLRWFLSDVANAYYQKYGEVPFGFEELLAIAAWRK